METIGDLRKSIKYLSDETKINFYLIPNDGSEKDGDSNDKEINFVGIIYSGGTDDEEPYVDFGVQFPVHENVFKLYREKDRFSEKDNDYINYCIDNGKIETDEIREDFFGWAEANFKIDDDLRIEFHEHYQNGLTHFQNLYSLVNFK